jgi:hypothetical protein
MSGAFLGQVEIKSGQKMTAELGTKKKTGNSSKKKKTLGRKSCSKDNQEEEVSGVDLRKF